MFGKLCVYYLFVGCFSVSKLGRGNIFCTADVKLSMATPKICVSSGGSFSRPCMKRRRIFSLWLPRMAWPCAVSSNNVQRRSAGGALLETRPERTSLLMIGVICCFDICRQVEISEIVAGPRSDKTSNVPK